MYQQDEILWTKVDLTVIAKSVCKIEDQWYNIIILDQEDQGGKNWDMKSAIQDCKLSDQTFYYYFLTTVSVGWNPLD